MIGWIIPPNIDQSERYLFISMCSMELVITFQTNWRVNTVTRFFIIPAPVCLSFWPFQVIGWLLPNIDQTKRYLFIAICSTQFIKTFQTNAGVNLVPRFFIIPGQLMSLVLALLDDKLDHPPQY
jgi:hypothetical protein